MCFSSSVVSLQFNSFVDAATPAVRTAATALCGKAVEALEAAANAAVAQEATTTTTTAILGSFLGGALVGVATLGGCLYWRGRSLAPREVVLPTPRPVTTRAGANPVRPVVAASRVGHAVPQVPAAPQIPAKKRLAPNPPASTNPVLVVGPTPTEAFAAAEDDPALLKNLGEPVDPPVYDILKIA